MSMSKLYIKSDDILFQEIDNEGLFLNLESGRNLRINSTATEIWNELDSSSNANNIANGVVDPIVVPLLSLHSPPMDKNR